MWCVRDTVVAYAILSGCLAMCDAVVLCCLCCPSAADDLPLVIEEDTDQAHPLKVAELLAFFFSKKKLELQKTR